MFTISQILGSQGNRGELPRPFEFLARQLAVRRRRGTGLLMGGARQRGLGRCSQSPQSDEGGTPDMVDRPASLG